MITKYKYNPLELAFCGFSGSGKTTLIEKLIKGLSPHYSIGFIKHDAHKFTMDKEGKDTQRMFKAGAASVFINDPTHWCEISKDHRDPMLHQARWSDFDFVFAEGYKKSHLPKILVEGDENSDSILNAHSQSAFDNVIGVVGPSKIRPALTPNELPYFHRDDLEAITLFILDRWRKFHDHTPLKALVLTGGKSSRMGRDKSMLNYHGKSQLEHCYNLLTQRSLETFVSCRSGQYKLDLPVIEDRFIGFGPMGGILSAMESDPLAAWLVVAVDLPFLDSQTLQDLINQRNPYSLATTYLSASQGLPEPLCTIYEPKMRHRLYVALGMGRKCPRKILINSPVSELHLKNPKALDNVNHPDELHKAQDKINHSTVGDLSL